MLLIILYFVLQFNDILNSFFSSAPFVAMIVATFLDNTLEARNRGERGLPWLEPFQYRKGDVRNDEFYGFPIRVLEMIPTRYLR